MTENRERKDMTKAQALDIILCRISWLEIGIETAVVSGTMTLRDMENLNRLRTALSDAKAAVRESMREECERNKEEEE